MKEIKLEKRYPHSREEDITDAFMRGYEKGKADRKAEPQTETEIAKAIVHKMIDDAVIAEDAYPDLRQKMHDAVDEYESQTEDEILREQCRAFMGIVEQTERSER